MDKTAPIPGLDWLIRPKIIPPRCADTVIERPRLAGRRLESLRSLTLFLAPPGYGKTTLAMQWSAQLRAAGFAVCWLSLDENDNDPDTFLSYLAAAFEESGFQGLRSLTAALGEMQPTLRARLGLAAMIHAIDAGAHKLFFVIEDVHRIDNPCVLGLLDTLIERTPANMHLCLTARARPNLKLAARRIQGQVSVLEAPELRFTLSETLAYFGPGHPHDAVLRLQESCEGWPVALQIAKPYLDGGAKTAEDFRFGGRSSELASYLTEQVIAALPAPLREAMMKTCALDRLSAPLIDHLTGRQDGARVLDALHAANLFVTPVGTDGMWFRYHPLFAEFLREHAAQADADALGRARVAAAEWFLRQGLVHDAVRLAREAGDQRLVARILGEAGGWRVILGGGPALLQAFSDLPAELVERSLRLRIGQILALIFDGRIAQGRAAFAEMIERAGGKDNPKLRDVYPDLLVTDLLLGGHGCEPLLAGSIDDLEAVLQSADRDDPVTEPIVFEFAALAQYWAGQFDRACDTALAAARVSRRRNIPFIQIYCELFCALALLERGQLERASSSLSDTAGLTAGLCGADDERVLMMRIFEADIALEKGDAAGAAATVLPALRTIEEGECWFDLYRVAFMIGIATIDASDMWLLLRQAERLSAKPELARLAGFAGAAALRRATAERDGARARTLFEYGPFQAILNGPVHDWRSESTVLLAAVDYAILNRDIAYAEALVARARPRLEALKHVRAEARLSAQEAVLHWIRGDEEAALALFDTALDIALRTGIRRPLFDHREEMAAMTERKRRGGRAPSEDVAVFLAVLSESLAAHRRGTPSGLSRREHEILHLIADGQTSKEVARQLGVSVNTVMTHRKSIYRKLDVATRSQVIVTARTRGLLY